MHAQSYLTLCKPLNCSPTGSSVLGTFQTRILEWVAISYSRGSSLLRDRTYVFCVSCRQILYCWATTEAWKNHGFCSVTKSCLTLCYPMNCRMPGFLFLHCHPEFAQTHVHWVGDAIQPPHTVPQFSRILNLSQHQDLLPWVSSLHQVAKVLELQHQSFQWIFRTDFL